MLDKRKCKGTHLYTYGLGCNEMVISKDRKYGLGRECGCQKEWLQTKSGQEYISKMVLPKAKSIVKKQRVQKNKEEKEKLIDYRSKLQSKVQEIARLIDVGLPCLARGYHANTIHGGHIYARGGNSSMALNLHNIHRQGAQSNHFQNDDGLLREGLEKEYGIDYATFIGELRRTKQLKYFNEEYKEFYRKASKISLKLKRDGNTFDLKERIIKRNEINIELGIYDIQLCKYEQS